MEKKLENPATPARMVRSLVIVVAVALGLGLLSKAGMEMLNAKMGLEEGAPPVPEEVPQDVEDYHAPAMPEYQPMELTESGSAVWNPDWKATPCSLFVAGGEDAIVDSLPQAPDFRDRPTELQLLMELWASHSGYDQQEIDNVWAFSSGDTCFIDLPEPPDWTAVSRTVESRFVSYTVLFPFVAGEAVSGYSEGMPLRGIPSR